MTKLFFIGKFMFRVDFTVFIDGLGFVEYVILVEGDNTKTL